MRLNHYSAVLTVALFCASSQLAQAQGAKGGAPHGGGKAASHMSSKGMENTNAKWSNDPDRGQERAAERHQLHNRRHTKHKQRHQKGHGPEVSEKSSGTTK